MADKPEVDEVTGTDTTSHEWDGIRELNTPLPKWWLYTFYACIVWAIGYTIAYPAWPLVTGATKGLLGYSTRGAFAESMVANQAAQSVYTDKIAALKLDQIAADPELMQFAQSGGAAIFRNYCSQCHGAGAAGVQKSGYPNLLDDDWLWGGTREDIHTTIQHGIRYEADEDTRVSEMPAFGADEILTPEDIEAVAEHVLSLSGAGPENTDGATIFAENCAACHGDNGQGDHSLGAPNLSDQIWLYGGEKERVVETITYARAGVMPAWAGRLDEEQIKQVALYVHSLGGGQ